MKPIQLKDARKRVKPPLTQEDLAVAIGRRQNYISRLEAGKAASPSFDDVMKMAQALGVDPGRLRFGGAK